MKLNVFIAYNNYSYKKKGYYQDAYHYKSKNSNKYLIFTVRIRFIFL